MSKKSNMKETRSRLATYPGELVRVPPTLDLAEAKSDAIMSRSPEDLQRTRKAELCVWDEKTGKLTDVGLHEDILSGDYPMNDRLTDWVKYINRPI